MDMNTTYRIMIIIKAFSLMLFVFGLLAWLDGAVIQLTYPQWLPLPVSHLLNIRTDTFTILMFILSAIGFFVWRVIVELSKPQKEAQK
ncbi:MAG: hypothetical protein M1167_02060 [Chloroflexi bacterium]|nr:hypothetical protein [Chloroflexota bacterium]